MSAFDDIAAEIQHGSDWYAQWLESLHTLRRTRPAGFDTADVGLHAWWQLTPEQRAHALHDLFVAYYTTLAAEAAELGQPL